MTKALTVGEMAALLGVSEREVRDLAKRGLLRRLQRGTYALSSITGYVTHLRAIAAGRGGESAALTLSKERARLAREQADEREMRNRQLRAELVPAADVAREWSDVLRTVRAGVMAVPSRVRATLPHLTAHDVATLDGELRRTLEGIAGHAE